MTRVNERGCYCEGWDTAPDRMRSAGHEPGHCGTCERCGAAGHTRHHPGPLPYTGAWCDVCYRRERFTWPLRYPPFWFFAAVAVGVLLWRFVAR